MFSTITSIFKAYLGSPSDSAESAAAAKTTVEALIAQNDIFVASKSYCPYCTRAKGLLSQLGADSRTRTLELDHNDNGVSNSAQLQTEWPDRRARGGVGSDLRSLMLSF